MLLHAQPPAGLPADPPSWQARLFGAVLLLSSALPGCSPAPPGVAPLPTWPLPSPTSTFSFPTLAPTSTPPPPPTATATLVFAQLGDLVFEDQFEAEHDWVLGSDDRGGTSIHDGRLFLAVRQPNATFLALSPAPAQSDFAFQIDVRAELCSDDDEFGLILRSRSSSEHYRAAFNCSGQARFVRVTPEGGFTLIPWASSPALISGEGSPNLIEVQAIGRRLRILANGFELYSLVDGTYSFGEFGVFGRASRQGQLTISFDRMRIWTISPAFAPTVTASDAPNTPPPE
jgi:hypothetical protein